MDRPTKFVHLTARYGRQTYKDFEVARFYNALELHEGSMGFNLLMIHHLVRHVDPIAFYEAVPLNVLLFLNDTDDGLAERTKRNWPNVPKYILIQAKLAQ